MKFGNVSSFLNTDAKFIGRFADVNDPEYIAVQGFIEEGSLMILNGGADLTGFNVDDDLTIDLTASDYLLCYISGTWTIVDSETVTGFGTPTVVGSVVTLPYTSESGVVEYVSFTLPNPVTVVNSIDLKAGTNPNELTVDIVYTDDAGVQQTISDTTPFDLTPFIGPWDNPDATPATQASADINYTEGNVGIGTQAPDVVLHVAGGTTENQSWLTPSPNEMLKAQNLVGGAVVSQIKTFGNNGDLQSNFAIAPRLTNAYTNGSDEGIFVWDLIGGGFVAPVVRFDYDTGWMHFAPDDGGAFSANEVMFGVTVGFVPDTKYTFGAGQMRLTAYGDGAFDDPAPTRLAGFDVDGRVVEYDIATALTGLAHTEITGIDLKPTGNPNEYTVEITWTDSDRVSQVTTDPTPINIVPTSVMVTNTVAGNRIATVTVDGAPVDINETITRLRHIVGLDGTTGDVNQFSLVYFKEDGTTDTVSLTELIPPTTTVTKETIRAVYDYAITAAGVATPIGAIGPLPVVTWTAGNGANGNGNDYVLTFPAGLVNPAIQVTVSGDIETGSGGDIDNAFTVQNVRMVSATVAGFTLYSGDDGGSEDEAARRDVVVQITYDKEVVTDVTLA